MSERVILLHGLMMRRPPLLVLANRLRRRGFTPLLFSYSTLWAGPDEAMERLAARLHALGPQPVHLVAHSLGGLIALETINRYQQQLPPGRVVCLGSPLAGSAAASGLGGKRLAFITGKSRALLCSGLGTICPQREVGMIAGSWPVGLGRFFGGFDGEHDGTVAVSETRFPGLADHAVVTTSHSGLIFSAQIAEMTANFLETGRFRP